jgi:hypothetical protein
MQKMQADQLELAEYQEAQRLLLIDYTAAKKALLQKFEGDLNHLSEIREEKKQILLAERRHFESSMANRSLVLTKKPIAASNLQTSRSQKSGNSQLLRLFRERPLVPASKLPPLRPPNPITENAKNSKAG